MTKAKGWAILGKRKRLRRDFDGTVCLYPTRGSAQDDTFKGERAVRVSINITPSEERKS